MPRIDLSIVRSAHPPSAAIGYRLLATRLMCNVCLRTPTGWTRYAWGVVDTGAAVSLFPLEVWKTAAFEDIGEVRVGGVIPRNECRISARLALVECVLSDGTERIGPLRIHAYLAHSNEVPTLIGMANLIERGVLHADIAAGCAYSEIRG